MVIRLFSAGSLIPAAPFTVHMTHFSYENIIYTELNTTHLVVSWIMFERHWRKLAGSNMLLENQHPKRNPKKNLPYLASALWLFPL